MVAALAGRRIDAPDGNTTRFPLARTAAVQKELRRLMLSEKVGLLVSSAACGSDLLALDAASEIGVRCRIVLPFDHTVFRQTSVVDRPGAWGPLYDRIVSKAARAGDLMVLSCSLGETRAFSEVNKMIVKYAAAAAAPASALAILVWEGQPRGDYDATSEFQRLADEAGMVERTVLTC
ncbi:hypothetical protein LB531_21985 [Mesorhizobium sp. CO1-1-2]|uniref:hypothetical protein n=1 Tax=Mesorhizobium sp. CO1-1-2 TaxID=2876635 RepID=UPI001CCEDBBA|nr:hypothetical protein [Mesorhizobium sp. CO1-1-2]MBZ9683330.1 hypothetical protein [Mesorhizobium sp. CO1-1-2]